MRAAFVGGVRPAVIKTKSFYKNMHSGALVAARFGRGDFFSFLLPAASVDRAVSFFLCFRGPACRQPSSPLRLLALERFSSTFRGFLLCPCGNLRALFCRGCSQRPLPSASTNGANARLWPPAVRRRRPAAVLQKEKFASSHGSSKSRDPLLLSFFFIL